MSTRRRRNSASASASTTTTGASLIVVTATRVMHSSIAGCFAETLRYLGIASSRTAAELMARRLYEDELGARPGADEYTPGAMSARARLARARTGFLNDVDRRNALPYPDFERQARALFGEGQFIVELVPAHVDLPPTPC